MLIKTELSPALIQKTPRRLLEDDMYYIGLDVHKVARNDSSRRSLANH